MKKDIVLFKGVKDGIIILLNDEIGFDIIERELNKKIIAAQDFFEGSEPNIMLSGRKLTDSEFIMLRSIIVKAMKINSSKITILEEKEEEVTDKNETTKNVKKENKNDPKDAFGDMPTKFHKGTLRSGQSIVFEGSVVILGDVNPGSQISAGGNIIVLGALKGIAHAGIKKKNAFVAALRMETVQIRIADVIGRAPDKKGKQKKKEKTPEMAYISEDSIYIEPIDNKILENY